MSVTQVLKYLQMSSRIKVCQNLCKGEDCITDELEETDSSYYDSDRSIHDGETHKRYCDGSHCAAVLSTTKLNKLSSVYQTPKFREFGFLPPALFSRS
jgi:hypothetical protein